MTPKLTPTEERRYLRETVILMGVNVALVLAGLVGWVKGLGG